MVALCPWKVFYVHREAPRCALAGCVRYLGCDVTSIKLLNVLSDLKGEVRFLGVIVPTRLQHHVLVKSMFELLPCCNQRSVVILDFLLLIYAVCRPIG